MRSAAAAALCAAILFGCSDTPTAPAPEPFVVTQSELIGGMSAPRIQYQAPISGRMSFEASWANPDVNLDLYMTPTGCVVFEGCGILERSDSATGTREIVSRSVVSGELLIFYVVNRSQVNQAVAFRFAIE